MNRKITLFIGSITGGGAERVICDLATFLSRKGYKTEILVATRTQERYQLDSKVKVDSIEPENYILKSI